MKTTSCFPYSRTGLALAAALTAASPLVPASMAAPVTLEWAARIDGPTNSFFQVGGISVTSSGDVFVAGHARRLGWNHDLTVSRYNASGALVWQKEYLPEEGSSANDLAFGIAVHGTNVYVTGTTTGTNGIQRFLTLKYRDNGDLEWARYYGGPSYADRATTLALDALGNAVVMGDSLGTNGNLDVLVVKYGPAGDLLWTYSYAAPGHLSDRAMGLKLDEAGNVHIAGTSTGGDGSPSVFTLKLNAAGQELWVAREHSIFSTGLNASGLDLDSAGNVATVGREQSVHMTWMYDANGNRRWVARYGAEEPASMYPTFVRFDSEGNVIAGANQYGAGVNDAILIKYNSDGRQLWAARIADPNGSSHLQGMDVDGAGNSYLISSPVSDVVTFKVGSTGAQLWSTAYNSSGLFTDYGQFLDVTPSGDFFVGARSVYFSESFPSLLKYTQQPQPGIVTAVVTPAVQFVDPGTNITFTAELSGPGPAHVQWRWNGRAMPGATGVTLTLTNVQVEHRGDYSVVVSNSNGVTISPEARLSVRTPPEVTLTPEEAVAYVGTDVSFFASVSGNDFVTLQWRHNGTNIPGAINDVLRLDNLSATDGGAYDVVATTPGGTATSSAAGLRISGAVKLVETTQHRSAPSTWEYAPQLKVLPTGQFLITAQFNSFSGSSIVLHKHTTNGEVLWSAIFESLEFTNGEPSNLVLDAAGNIFITAISQQPYLTAALALLKYSPDGQLLWSRVRAGTNLLGSIHSFAVDSAGNCVIATLGQGTEVIRYNNAGEVQWSYLDPSLDNDTIAAAVDSAGNSYLGTTIRVGGDNEIRLRKFDSTGAAVWTQSYAEGMYNRLGALAVDSTDHLIVAGTGELMDVPDSRMFVAKYSPAGQKLWETRTGSSWSELAYIVAMGVGPGDEITVLTESDDDYPPGEQSGVTRIGSAGQFRYRIGEPQILVSKASQLALDSFGNAYVTGYGGRPVTGADAVTAKYDASGNRPWLVYHDGPGLESWEIGLTIGVDAAGEVRVLASEGFGSETIADFSVLHYRQKDPAGTFRVQLIPDAAGTFHLGVPTGQVFRVEASTDLRNWDALEEEETQRLLQPGGTAFSSSTKRFFRLVAE